MFTLWWATVKYFIRTTNDFDLQQTVERKSEIIYVIYVDEYFVEKSYGRIIIFFNAAHFVILVLANKPKKNYVFIQSLKSTNIFAVTHQKYYFNLETKKKSLSYSESQQSSRKCFVSLQPPVFSSSFCRNTNLHLKNYKLYV